MTDRIRLMNRAIAGAALLLVASFAHAAKIEQRTLTSKGVKRTYSLFVPDSVTKDHPAPLIVTLHGSGRNGKSLVSSWQSLAEKEGIVLAGPDASDFLGWASPVDGPVFLHDVVEDVKASVPIDEHRVYLFGHSAGASFGLLMARAEAMPVPQIFHLFDYKPHWTKHLAMFTQSVMRGDSPLSPGERELIAAFTSRLRNCHF